MRAILNSTLTLISLATIPACFTTKGNGRVPNSNATVQAKGKPIAKEGAKAKASEYREPIAVAKPLGVSFARLNDPTIELMDEDIQQATALNPAPAGSLEEAVVVLTQLRLSKRQIDQASKFASRNLYEPGQQPDTQTSQEASLEKQFLELKINLPEVLSGNAFLKGWSSLSMTKHLLDSTSNSQSFKENIQLIVDTEAKKWTSLLQVKEAVADNDSTQDGKTATSNDDEETPIAESDSSNSENHTALPDLKRSDAILMQAQRLADKGEFKQAIDQTARIDDRDPFFEQAQEKIKVYSNRAVQDLRQKAALAFQNARPVADPKAKSAYLKQAKYFLEKALKDYPTADQLETVRANLAVIVNDLSSLEQDDKAKLEK